MSLPLPVRAQSCVNDIKKGDIIDNLALRSDMELFATQAGDYGMNAIVAYGKAIGSMLGGASSTTIKSYKRELIHFLNRISDSHS